MLISKNPNGTLKGLPLLYIYVNGDTINLIGNKTVLLLLSYEEETHSQQTRGQVIDQEVLQWLENFKTGFMDINLDHDTVCNLQLGFMDMHEGKSSVLVMSTFRGISRGHFNAVPWKDRPLSY